MAKKWKSDALYQRILSEVQALWDELPAEDGPELLRVEERATTSWEMPAFSGALLDVWVIDDSGIRLVPMLRRENHDPGTARGEFWRFGLIQFTISENRDQVSLGFDVGPEISGELGYDVHGEGVSLQLLASSSSLSM